MAFTTLMLFQLFNVFNARSDERSAFDGLFTNRWLWAAVGLSLLLHVAVIYVPFLQQAFSTVSLSASDWLRLRGGGELGAVAARAEQNGYPHQAEALDAYASAMCADMGNARLSP